MWLVLFNISLNHLTNVIFWCNIHSIKQHYLEVNYFAHLSNEKQMTLGDLQAQIPQYRNDRKDVRFIFPDELNGFSVMAYDEKLALETFGKGADYRYYVAVAQRPNRFKILKSPLKV